MCPGSQTAQPCPGVHQARHSQPAEGGDCPTLHCSGVPSLRALCAVWAPQYKEDIRLLECIQTSGTKMVKGLKSKTYKEWLRSLGLFSLEQRRLRGDLITACNFLGGGQLLLSWVTSGGTQGDGMKLHKRKFTLGIRKRFFMEKVVSHWNRLPRAVVMAPSLSELKEHLDNALSHMV